MVACATVTGACLPCLALPLNPRTRFERTENPPNCGLVIMERDASLKLRLIEDAGILGGRNNTKAVHDSTLD
jgi:hypothetical protein